ncbi:MAG: response regulator [Thermodesulfovibrionales bacterium]|jgi:DNA-binding response OmpR family regulator
MKILVIDDEESKCRLYQDELENEGYAVVTAQTGAEGMELFKKENPDLVTLDIYMSHKDEGIDLLRKMKEMRPKIPIIMLTAYDYRDEFAIWCADAYIVKSSDLTELKSTIKRTVKDGRREICCQ